MKLPADKSKTAAKEENSKQEAAEPAAQWQYHQEGSTEPATINGTSEPAKKLEPVTWSASEFIAHQKSAKWYALLGLTTVVLAGLVYLITRDKITAGVIIFAAFVFGFYAARKPRVLQYRLDENGLGIGGKSYAYELFKSFSLVEEGALMGIILMPLKRFMPTISLYFEPKDEKKITTLLAERLPVEEHKPDIVDRFIKQIRF